LTTATAIRFRTWLWLALVTSGLILAWATGRLQPHLVPDSPSYLDYPFGSLDALLRSIRSPGYPCFLWLIIALGGIRLVPACQVVMHATAVWLLVLELRSWSMPKWQWMAVAVAVGVGCTPMDHIQTISTDALAASLGVMTAALTLRWARLEASLAAAGLAAALAVITIMVRPAYLFLVPWLFIGGGMLCCLRGQRPSRAFLSSLRVAVFALLPVLGWVTLRSVVVGEFAMLPFGHQNLAGILIQLVSDDELQNLKGQTTELAGEIVAQKKQLAASGHRFAPGDDRATMTIDARWDDMTYLVVVAAAENLYPEDRVTQHRSVAELNRSIIRGWPQRYMIWLLKAVRRGAWTIAADIVMHPLFLVVIAAAVVAALHRAIWFPAEKIVWTNPPAMSALTILAFTYLIMKVGFVILTSPPIGRFSDAAAIFLPAWLGARLVGWWCAERIPS